MKKKLIINFFFSMSAEKKRKLTPTEIMTILKVIDIPYSIPSETKKSILAITQNDIASQLKDIEIYPSLLPKLKQKILQNFHETLISPGESVGVLTAQSIGERQTQMTLNSFHSAGLAIKTVVTGVPKFSELLNATKEPKAKSCDIYLTKNNSSLEEIQDYMSNVLMEVYLRNLISSFTFFESGLPEKPRWYSPFMRFNGITETDFEGYGCLILELNRSKIFNHKLTLEFIAKKIESEFNDIFCVYSSTSALEFHIYIDLTNIQLPEDRESFINEDSKNLIFLEEVILPNIKTILICGIQGVQKIFYVEDKNCKGKWMIETEGSNFKKILSLANIDIFRTISNNMWDIYNCLGIEATREFLIEEFMNVVSSDGTYINERHVALLVDIMTSTGAIASVSRYGMKRETIGPLAKASFEESLDNFLKAGVFGDVEQISGISASIMCARRSRVGTGICDLVADIPKFIGTGIIRDGNIMENVNPSFKSLSGKLLKPMSGITKKSKSVIQDNEEIDFISDSDSESDSDSDSEGDSESDSEGESESESESDSGQD